MTTQPKLQYSHYILQGQADMRVGDQTRRVGPGDAIAIAPGQVHQITNIGPCQLRLLCMCAPAYEHDDTVLVEP